MNTVILMFKTFIQWMLMLLPYTIAAIIFLIIICYIIDAIDREKKVLYRKK